MRGAWIVIPGTLFWVLIGVGATTDNDAFIGAAVVIGVGSIAVFLGSGLKRHAAESAERRRIWDEGRPATARVVTLTDTGSRFNRHPVCVLELEVSDGGTTRRASVRAVVSTLAVPRVQPGCEVAVRVDRADESAVVIDPALTVFG